MRGNSIRVIGFASGKRTRSLFMPLSFKLEHVIEQLVTNQSADEKLLLKNLAGVKLSAGEARAVWPRVLDHKWYVSERLGRDVGLKVAPVGYFENVEPIRQARLPRAGLPPSLPFLRPLVAIGEWYQ